MTKSNTGLLDYISMAYRLHRLPESNVSTIMSHYFSSKTTEWVEVFSTNVYPQLISNTTSQTIVWDVSYWSLYMRFLYGIWTEELYSKRRGGWSMYTWEDSNYYESIGMLFLSLRHYRQGLLSFTFSKMFASNKNAVPSFCDRKISPLTDSFIETHFCEKFCIAKAFVFLHEFVHLCNRTETKDDNATRLKIMKVMVGGFAEDNPKSHVSNIAKSLANSEDDVFLEEIYDDWRALQTCLDDWPLFIPELDSKKACVYILQSYLYLMHFQSFLAQTDAYWRNIESITSVDELRLKEDSFALIRLESRTRASARVCLVLYLILSLSPDVYNLSMSDILNDFSYPVTYDFFPNFERYAIERLTGNDAHERVMENYHSVKCETTILQALAEKRDSNIGWV